MKTQEKSESDDPKYKLNSESGFGTIINSYSITKEDNKVEERKKDLTDIPPNIGSITITPVPNNTKVERKVNNTTMPLEKPKESLIRIKSPAALNEMVKKEKEKLKKLEKANPSKEKRLELPLQIDTSFTSSKKEPSPKTKLEEINPKQIEAMRLAENNIPRPGLIAIHSSPTFAKPDKRPPDFKKKKDILIVSDLDPLGDAQQESVAVDDSSSDVEVIEEKTDKSDTSDNRIDIVPFKDSVSEKKANSVKPMSLSLNKDRDGHKKVEQLDEETKELFDIVKTSIRELEHSQEPTKLNCNSYGDSVTNNAQNELL